MTTAKDRIIEFCMATSLVPENLFVKKLRAGGLTDEQIVVVISALQTTCDDCLDGPNGCTCMADARDWSGE